MHPLLLFPIAVLTPLVLGACLIVPIYGAALGSTYMIYAHAAPQQAATLLSRWQDPTFIYTTYEQLFTYWHGHMDKVDTLYYTVPLFLPPLIGLFVAQFLVRRIVRRLVELFHLVSGR